MSISKNLFQAAANNAAIPVFVTIDEYDHFANKLIAMGRTYKDEVKAGGIVRSFYELLKAIGSSGSASARGLKRSLVFLEQEHFLWI